MAFSFYGRRIIRLPIYGKFSNRWGYVPGCCHNQQANVARSDVVEMHCRIILPLHVATESRSPFSVMAVLYFELFYAPVKLLKDNTARAFCRPPR